MELQRFIEAQQSDFRKALSEIKHGRKQSHWMWYIFPQIRGLGFSETSRYYAIQNIHEAEQYVHHPILGKGLIELCQTLMESDGNDAHRIFGSPDHLKLHSSITLFASLPNANPVFQLILDKFFKGKKDDKTVRLLKENNHTAE